MRRREFLAALACLPGCHVTRQKRAKERYTPQAPEDALTLAGSWDPDNVTGSPATSLTDLSGNGYTLTSSAGVPLGTTATSRNWTKTGVATFNFTGGATQRARSATKAPWKPLHDGTGVWFSALVNPRAHNQQDFIFATYQGSSSEVGASAWHDSSRQRASFQVVSGDGAGATFDLRTWEGSAPNDRPYLLEVVFKTSATPDLQIFINGQLAAAASLNYKVRPEDTQKALSSANPSEEFTLGCLEAGDLPLDGELGRVNVAAYAPTPAQHAILRAWYARKYGLGMDGHLAGKVVFKGNSIIDETWRSDDVFPYDVRPLLRKPALCMNMGVYALRQNEMNAMAAAHSTPHYDASRPFNVMLPYEIINRLTETTKEATMAEWATGIAADVAVGWDVVPPTLLPVDNVAISEATWNWCNAYILANYASLGCAGVCDTTGDATLGAWASRLDTSLFSDGVHLTAACYSLWVPYVANAINGVLPNG